MSIPTPKVRLIIVHDRGGVKSVHNKCRLTEQANEAIHFLGGQGLKLNVNYVISNQNN